MFACTMSVAQIMSSFDVCKTPSPNGLVPVPYPNIAFTSQCVNPASKVKIVGMPALNKKSKCLPSAGDEPGSAGGARSSMIKGQVVFTSASKKVKIQGSPAVRDSDATKHNQGNAEGKVSAPSQFKVKIN